MATKIPAAQNRMFKNIFICKNCGGRMRAEPRKIISGLVKCRHCGRKAFKAVRKK